VPLRNPRSSGLVLACAACSGALAIAVAMFGIGGTNVSTQFVWIAAASVAVAALLAALAGVWTAAAVYGAVFWCFHFGLVATVAIGYFSPSDVPAADESWILSPFGAEAAVVSFAGMCAFTSGACLVYWLRRKSASAAQAQSHAVGDVAHPYGGVGSFLVFAALASWCAVVLLAGGVSGFFKTYEEFRDMTSAYAVPIGMISPTLACGIVVAFTGARGWHRTAAIAAFACFAVVALPIGLRTDVMFPAVAVIVASARCGRAFSPLKAAALGLGLVLLIPIVREVRSFGVGALGEAIAKPRLDALVEMGGSLRPVEQVVRWHAEGDQYELGASYWAPVERAAARLLPDVQASAADNDMRLMNVLVLDRIGAIGFSPVAEAFRNFGPLGVVLVLALVGMALAAIDTIRDRRLAVLAIATLYPPLLINVRNSFVAVPVQCLAGILLLVGVAALRHMFGSVITRTYAHPSYVRR